jgi:hypothetical protein
MRYILTTRADFTKQFGAREWRALDAHEEAHMAYQCIECILPNGLALRFETTPDSAEYSSTSQPSTWMVRQLETANALREEAKLRARGERVREKDFEIFSSFFILIANLAL